MFYAEFTKMKHPSESPKTRNGLIQMIRMEKSTGQKCFDVHVSGSTKYHRLPQTTTDYHRPPQTITDHTTDYHRPHENDCKLIEYKKKRSANFKKY